MVYTNVFPISDMEFLKKSNCSGLNNCEVSIAKHSPFKYNRSIEKGNKIKND